MLEVPTTKPVTREQVKAMAIKIKQAADLRLQEGPQQPVVKDSPEDGFRDSLMWASYDAGQVLDMLADNQHFSQEELDNAMDILINNNVYAFLLVILKPTENRSTANNLFL